MNQIFFFFRSGLFKKELTSLMVKEHIPFKKEYIYYVPSKEGSQTYSEELLDKILRKDFASLAVIEEDDEAAVKYMFNAMYKQYESVFQLSWSFEDTDFITQSLINVLINEPGFVCGTIWNSQYVMHQSETNPDMLGYAGIHVPAEQIIYNSKTGRREVDITKNPGRRKMIGPFMLVAAPEMWYGKEMIDLIGRKHLLDFKDAERVEELTNGAIYIKLFDLKEDSATEKNSLKQKKFRSWTSMDKLEEDLKHR